MTPEKIGKYTVLELLGRGGMGEVYLGEDPYIGRRVAIKMIKGADPQARDRFLHEARVVGGLTHPAVVSLLDFDFSGDEPFLVMEYLKGQGLDAWIRNPHSLAEQLVVLEDLCQALAYAHENGVLHRDVKPSNVQILPNGHAKLMDFGIARGEAGKLTATGAVMGTPEYMAPEILNDAAYSSRSDLFACSVLLYEMFTGSNPFAAKTVAATLTNILTLNPPDIRSIHPDFPPHLAEALMACLRKEPEQRPDGFGALISAAREARERASSEGIPETRAIPRSPSRTPAPPTHAVGESASPSQSRRWAPAAGVGVAVIVGLLWILSPNGPPPAPAPGVTATPAPTPVSETPAPDPAVEPTAAERVQSEAPPKASPAPSISRARTPRTVADAPIKTAEPVPTPAPRDSPTPTPAPSVSVAVIQPTPPPQPAASPIPTANVTPAPPLPTTPNPSLSSVSPRSVRRGSSVVLSVEGTDLRRDLTASVLQGRRPAAGIKVVRQEFVNSSLVRVTILIEPEVPLLAYTLVFRSESGALTQGVQIEVVL